MIVTDNARKLVDSEGRDRDWICIRGRKYLVVRVDNTLLTTEKMFEKYLPTASTFAVVDGKICTIRYKKAGGIIAAEIKVCEDG